jgi:hypothetical protein
MLLATSVEHQSRTCIGSTYDELCRLLLVVFPFIYRQAQQLLLPFMFGILMARKCCLHLIRNTLVVQLMSCACFQLNYITLGLGVTCDGIFLFFFIKNVAVN